MLAAHVGAAAAGLAPCGLSASQCSVVRISRNTEVKCVPLGVMLKKTVQDTIQAVPPRSEYRAMNLDPTKHEESGSHHENLG